MRWLAEVRERVRGIFLRSREDSEMDEELTEHLRMQTAPPLPAHTALLMFAVHHNPAEG